MEQVAAFLADLKARGVARGTLRYTEDYLAAFFGYLRGRGIGSAREVTPGVLEEYRRHVIERVSPRTKRRRCARSVFAELAAVRKYFRYLTRHRHILFNPSFDLTVPVPPVGLPRNILSEQEARALLAKPDQGTAVGRRDRAILEVMYSAGLRRQEVVNLDVHDVDLKAQTVRVRRGKNGKDRVVPAGRAACGKVRRYLVTARKRLVKGKVEQALFVTRRGGRMTPQTLNYLVKSYGARVAPGKQVTCHTLRHTCATHLLRGGANLRVIQELLGHASLASTQIYTRVAPVDLKEAHARHHPRPKRRSEGKWARVAGKNRGIML